MKISLSIPLIAAGIPFFCPSAKAVDFVRQIQIISGQTVVYDTPIAWKSGDMRSQPIKGDGAIFQLYAYDDASLSPFTVADANVGQAVHANVALDSHLVNLDVLGIHLDIILGDPTASTSLPKMLSEKAVGTYIPETQIVVASKDTHYPPRTRADQPFDVQFSVGKLPDPTMEIPANAPTKVTITRSYKLYHPTLYIPSSNGTGQGTYSQGLDLKLNGNFMIPAQYQQLPGSSPTKAVGEETYTASVKIGSSTAQVGATTIQIWPVATTVIEGVPANARFTNVPDSIRATVTDLYPDSVTYARIYPGVQSLGSVGRTIPSSIISYNTYSPQNAVIPVTGLEEFIDQDGVYTVEIVTVTPFNNRQPERMAYTTFTVDRTLDVRASLTTSNEN